VPSQTIWELLRIAQAIELAGMRRAKNEEENETSLIAREMA
jgi:hypothetical protein